MAGALDIELAFRALAVRGHLHKIGVEVMRALEPGVGAAQGFGGADRADCGFRCGLGRLGGFGGAGVQIDRRFLSLREAGEAREGERGQEG